MERFQMEDSDHQAFVFEGGETEQDCLVGAAKLDAIVTGLCQNDATYSNGGIDAPCICKPGFVGGTCADIDYCHSVACSNNGACINGVDTYTCDCLPGFEGVDCATNIDDCPEVTCSNHGSCVDGIEGHTCDCDTGYYGEHCDLVASALPDTCAAIEEDLNAMQTTFESLNANVAELDAQVSKVYTDVRADVSDQSGAVFALEANVVTLAADVSVQKESIDSLDSSVATGLTFIASLTTEATMQKNSMLEMESKMDDLQGSIVELESNVQSAFVDISTNMASGIETAMAGQTVGIVGIQQGMANLAVDATAQEQSILDIETKLADLDNAVKNINATNTQILAILEELALSSNGGCRRGARSAP